MSRRRRWPWILAFSIAIVAGGVIGLLVATRVKTGRWEAPSVELITVALSDEPPAPSKVIYLNKDKVTITPGTDDAPHGVSSVAAAIHPDGPVTMPGWKGSKKAWGQVVTCVKKMFQPFDVEVTDERPTTDNFLMVAVGGRPKDLGSKDKRVSGLAPFNGDVIPKAVVYGFAAQVGHDVRVTCETIAMEVAHAYGLDHEYLCKDVMTYLSGCKNRSFVDKDAPCGEKKKRACHGGAATQNSYQRLLSVLGAAPASGPTR